MNKKVSKIQMGMLLSLVICGFFLGMCDIMMLRKSSSEVIISMILGGVIGVIPLLMYLKINDTYPSLNIYEKCTKLFGKKIGIIINILITILYSFIFIVAVHNIVSLATSKYLENTPYMLVGILVIIYAFFACFKGIETILRLTQISFIVTILASFLIETAVIKYVDINNLLPFFTSKNTLLNIIYGAFYFTLTSSILCTLLLSIKKDEIKDNKKYNKTAILFYIYSVISLIIVMFFVIACFGYKMATLFRYPEYMILKKIGFSSSELHLENLLAFRWTFYSLTLAIISLYGILTSIKRYIKSIKTSKITTSIIAFLCLYIGKKVLSNIPYTLIIMKNYYIPFIGIPIILLLTIIFIKCFLIKK